MEQRKATARRLLLADPHRSNTEVATLAGISTSTVRRLRPTDATTARTGIDGKTYPQDHQARRRAALRLLRQHPDWSARRIAREVQLSPTTVSTIRNQLATRPSRTARLRRMLQRCWRWLMTHLARRHRSSGQGSPSATHRAFHRRGSGRPSRLGQLPRGRRRSGRGRPVASAGSRDHARVLPRPAGGSGVASPKSPLATSRLTSLLDR